MKMTKEEQQKRREQGKEFARRQEAAGFIRVNIWLTKEEKAMLDLIVAERKAREQIAEAQRTLAELQKKKQQQSLQQSLQQSK